MYETGKTPDNEIFLILRLCVEFIVSFGSCIPADAIAESSSGGLQCV
jgi:hypothetical protein